MKSVSFLLAGTEDELEIKNLSSAKSLQEGFEETFNTTSFGTHGIIRKKFCNHELH